MDIDHLILGFVIKTLASLDDTFTKVPVLLGLTRSRVYKFAFALGNMIALLLAVFLAIFFSSFFINIPWFRYFVGGVILILSILIYFDVFAKGQLKVGEKVIKSEKLTTHRFIEIGSLGFVVSFVTLFDDTLVFIPLFISSYQETFSAVIGIVLATIIQLVFVIFFSELLEKLTKTS